MTSQTQSLRSDLQNGSFTSFTVYKVMNFHFHVSLHETAYLLAQDVHVGFAPSSVGSAVLKKQHLGITNIFRILMLQFHNPLGQSLFVCETTRNLEEVRHYYHWENNTRTHTVASYVKSVSYKQRLQTAWGKKICGLRAEGMCSTIAFYWCTVNLLKWQQLQLILYIYIYI